MVVVRFQPDHPNFELPKQETELAAGFDLRYLPDHATKNADGEWVGEAIEKTLAPMERALLPLGFKVEVPKGYEMQLRPRSGLAKKHGITLVNTPGTVDADYRGKVGALVVNIGTEPFTFEPGMRVCQAVISAVPEITLELVDSLSETERGEGGFGSTGHR